jgi:hypothetical protein
MTQNYTIPLIKIRIGRFLFLLISLLLIFVLQPFFEGLIGISLLMDIFITVVLISGVYAISQKRSIFMVSLILAILTVLTRWPSHFVNSPLLNMLGNMMGLLFLGYMVVTILSHIFQEDEITSDLIMGSICAYFLIGFLWAFLYSLLEMFQPGSFQMAKERGTDIANFSYYSYVTLTTLGYGDITPLSQPARSLSTLEAITGQLYIAVLIARLVGIHIAQKSSSKS